MLSEQGGRGFILIFNLILSIFFWLVEILSEHSLANNKNRNLFLVSKSNCIRKSFTWTIVAPLSYFMPLYLWFLLIISTCLMRLSLISWIINTKVWVICQCWRLRQMRHKGWQFMISLYQNQIQWLFIVHFFKQSAKRDNFLWVCQSFKMLPAQQAWKKGRLVELDMIIYCIWPVSALNQWEFLLWVWCTIWSVFKCTRGKIIKPEQKPKKHTVRGFWLTIIGTTAIILHVPGF